MRGRIPLHENSPEEAMARSKVDASIQFYKNFKMRVEMYERKGRKYAN